MTLLEVRAVRKSYGGIAALAGCSLGVEAGTITGLIGPNGSGKTTLFNVVSGYERPGGGQVLLAGRDLTGAPPDKVTKAGLGRTFQIPRVFDRLTLAENMQVGRRSEHERVRELLETVGLLGLAGELAGSLSYGQRKLLELAVVMSGEPQLVLLDEPAAGINPSLIIKLAERIQELNAAGVTFLVVEHDVELVMSLCDHVLVMHQGAVIASGLPTDVRKDATVIDAYLGEELDV